MRDPTHELMASDILAVMDALRIEKSHLVGWSDGADIALILARQAPARVTPLRWAYMYLTIARAMAARGGHPR
jgi:pimeloyl-ACP methyl ester carboxylesterase